MYQSIKKYLLLSLLLSSISIKAMEKALTKRATGKAVETRISTDLDLDYDGLDKGDCLGEVKYILIKATEKIGLILTKVVSIDQALIIFDAAYKLWIPQIGSFANTIINKVSIYLGPDSVLAFLPEVYEISNFENLLTKRYSNNDTVLHVACNNDDIASIKIMYKMFEQYRENLNFQSNNSGHLPIHVAASNGSVEIINTLIQMQRNAGNDPWQLISRCDENRNTPLHIAVFNGHTETTRTLMRLADDNLLNFLLMQDRYNRTALEYAQEEGHIEIVEILIEAFQNRMTSKALLKLIQRTPTENQAEMIAILKEKYLKPMDCSICFETKNGAEYDIMDCCNEPFCTACLNDYLTVCLESTSVELKCPNQNCSKTIEEPTMQAITLNNKIIYDRYLDAGLNEYLRNKQAKQCQTPNCPYGFIKDPECNEIVVCSACEHEYCSQCLYNHNLDITCERARIERDPDLAYDATLAWVTKNAMQCHKCGNGVQRNKGCNHMTCKCRYQFCYVCGKKWGSRTCRPFSHSPV